MARCKGVTAFEYITTFGKIGTHATKKSILYLENNNK